MNLAAINRFRSMLRSDRCVYGLWVTLESPSVTEIAVALGLDWVVIDAEHGHLDWNDIVAHLRATVRSRTVALVRVAELNSSLIKRCLDLGADGVVIPWVETVDQLQQAVTFAHYPPEGRRGIGGERATVWGQCLSEHTTEANEHVLVVPMIESVAAIEAVPAMCRLPEVEVFFFGPADFSSSAGYRGQWEGPGVAKQIIDLKTTIRAAGKHCGTVTTNVEDLLRRQDNGFQMLGLGADTGLMMASLHERLRSIGRDRMPATSLDPDDGCAVTVPISRPAEEMRPDRREVITPLSDSQVVELQAGVTLQTLVGDFNTARKLMTGIVTFGPEAMLDYHTHPCSESITVLEGEAEISVDGRVYRLGQLDNIVIPRWLPHAARNPNPAVSARLHVALAMSSPDRELVSRPFERIEMPPESTGVAGFERVNRLATATRSTGVGLNAEFIDFFNSDLMPGIEMSGGYALFDPQGRLPAHLHDFDESICIIDGQAICVVEGRRYTMGDCQTAMVPRGRVHYFINETEAAMGMIWVYAGPRPERIVVDDVNATVEGSPWN
jgi:2-dehydro-3-deoxyglucarate aldolase/4-hydroxy-2-oxoheptanedioate aldolase